MTDFFAELEGHLHGAARRRARRGPRVVAMAAAATASVALVLALLATLDVAGDPEIAAPPAPVAACEGPALAVLDRFAVLRREATAADVPPQRVVEALSHESTGLNPPAKTWPESARLARTHGERDFWLFPVALESCRPGVCWVSDAEDAIGACHPLDGVRRPVMMMGSEEPGATFVSALVPDGEQPPGGTTEGNVFIEEGVSEFEPVEPEQPACGTPTLTTAEPAPELLEILPDLRDGTVRKRDDEWHQALARQPVIVHVHSARRYNAGSVLEVVVVAYTPLPPECHAEGVPTEAGACVVAGESALCFTGSRIAEGRAVIYDVNRKLAYALVPAGTTNAKWSADEMRIDGNFAHLRPSEADGPLVLDP